MLLGFDLRPPSAYLADQVDHEGNGDAALDDR